MPAPPWLAASPGSPGVAGQVNQFLGAHAISYVYGGATVASQTTLGSAWVDSNGLYIAQKFTTGAGTTSLGRVVLWLGYTGTPPGPLVVGIYADSAGPTGSPLVSTAVPKEFVNASGGVVSIPLPATATPSTAYWIVTTAIGDASDYFMWAKSNQVTGASTSPNGTTWTAQAYGLYFQVQDGTASGGGLTHMWEDSGARWTTVTYNGNGQIAAIREYTVGQVPTAYTVSARSLSYSGGTLTGVT